MAYQPHDTLAKSFLTNLEVAKDFLTAHLPQYIKSQCNFASLRIEASSFIDEDLKPHVADILYSLEINHEPGLIYCVIEAQDIPQKLMPFRMLRYQIAGLKKHAENHNNDKLPLIIPIVLYTGAHKPYPYSMNFYDCFADPQLAEKTFLQPKLIDLSVIPDAELKTHGYAAFLEIVAKHIRDRDILKLAYDIAELIRTYRLTRELYVHMLNYVLKEGETPNYNEFLKIIIDQSAEYKDDTMSIASRLKEDAYKQGMHMGIEQGKEQALSIASRLKEDAYKQGMHMGIEQRSIAIAKNMLVKGVDVKFIKEVTGLNDQDILKLIEAH